MYYDKKGYPVDASQDGGDSARALGLLAAFGTAPVSPDAYFIGRMATRHPTQIPWNNPWNFSRDQLMCFIMACSAAQARTLLYGLLTRFFFAQNFQRDYEGTWKYPWPHTFVNDKGQVEHRSFDFADPLLPHHVFHIVLRARFYPLYVLAPLAYTLMLLSIAFNRTKGVEQNQMQCMVKNYGLDRAYTFLSKYWKEDTLEYWNSRGVYDLPQNIIAYFEKGAKP